MDSEKIRIVDDRRRPLGVTTREEVHRKGYWHETFHCWVCTGDQEEKSVYLQLRSPQKKDFPNLLDITAAGHILADESIEDGIRELHEEIGLPISIEELLSLGIIKIA